MLSARGFNALRNLEANIAPGISALARAMNMDSNCCMEDGVVGSDKTYVLRLTSEDRSHIIVPRSAGICIYSSAVGAAPKDSMGRVTVVRLERNRNELTCGMRRLVLEDYDVNKIGGRDNLSTAFRAGKWSARRTNKATRKRYLDLPVSYATLLDNAKAPNSQTRKKNNYAASLQMWKWRRQYRYRPSPNRVVPGIGEEDAEEQTSVMYDRDIDEDKSSSCDRDRSQTIGSTVKDDRSGNGVLDKVSDWKEKDNNVLTLRRVESAPWALAAEWASTRGLVLALVTAACRREPDVDSSDKEAEAESISRTSRLTACALLAKVVHRNSGAGLASREVVEFPIQTEILTVLDEWYDSFWVATAPFRSDRGLLQENPRLLLIDMLEIPIVRNGFLKRGLFRRLTDGLIAAAEVYWAGVCETGGTCMPTGSDAITSALILSTHDSNTLNDITDAMKSRKSDVKREGGRRTAARGGWRGEDGRSNERRKNGGAFDKGNHEVDHETSPLFSRTGSQRDDQRDRCLKDAAPWWRLLRSGQTTGENCYGESGDEEKGEGEEVKEAEEAGECDIGRYPSGGLGEEPNESCNATATDSGCCIPTESGRTTGRESITVMYGRDDVVGGENLSGPPVVTIGGEEPGGGQDEATGEGAEQNVKERATPPLLRLDVLKRVRGEKDWLSPRSSPQTAATLSAASTRAPPHLVSLCVVLRAYYFL